MKSFNKYYVTDIAICFIFEVMSFYFNMFMQFFLIQITIPILLFIKQLYYKNFLTDKFYIQIKTYTLFGPKYLTKTKVLIL